MVALALRTVWLRQRRDGEDLGIMVAVMAEYLETQGEHELGQWAHIKKEEENHEIHKGGQMSGICQRMGSKG